VHADDVKVSIGMPVFNGSNFIAEAIESVLAQSLSDFELIITDNASTDDTCEIVESYAARDERIRLIRNEKNIGAAANYNRSYEVAQGKYLKWCAHDDSMSPNVLEACVDTMETDPTVSLAFPRTIGIDDQGNIIKAVGDSTPSLLDEDPSVRFQKSILLAGTCFPIFGVFRKSQLDRSTLHRAYYGSDRGLLAEIAIMGKFKRVDDAIFYNREHTQRSINIDDKLVRSEWQNGASSRKASSEHINLSLHLYEIAGRHRDISPAWKMRRKLIPHALSPRQIGRYGLEATGLLSPKAASLFKSLLSRRNKTSQRI